MARRDVMEKLVIVIMLLIGGSFLLIAALGGDPAQVVGGLTW